MTRNKKKGRQKSVEKGVGSPLVTGKTGMLPDWAMEQKIIADQAGLDDRMMPVMKQTNFFRQATVSAIQKTST